METINQIINLIPAAWRVPVAIAALAVPYVTRAYYAIKNGGGLRGIWRAIMFGTNTPK